MTPEEDRFSAATDGWLQSWNSDIEKMVDEYYAPDCEVLLVESGELLHGREELRKFERGLRATFPARGAELARKVVSGNTVVVELERKGYLGDGRASVRRSCVVLTFNVDAQVQVDHSYVSMSESAKQIGVDPEQFAAEMVRRGSTL